MKRINCSGSRSAELTVSTKLKYQYHGSHVYTWKCQGRCWWAAFNCMPHTWVERRIPRLEQAYWGKGRQNHEVMFKLNFSHSHNHPRISEALTPHKLAIRNRRVEIVWENHETSRWSKPIHRHKRLIGCQWKLYPTDSENIERQIIGEMKNVLTVWCGSPENSKFYVTVWFEYRKSDCHKTRQSWQNRKQSNSG